MAAVLDRWLSWHDIRFAFRSSLPHERKPFQARRRTVKQDFAPAIYVNQSSFPHAHHLCARVLLAADGAVTQGGAAELLDGRIGDYEAAAPYRQLHVPHWSLALDVAPLRQPMTPHELQALLRAKKHFCAFVQHETLWQLRQDFYERLSRRRYVHCLGNGLRNQPRPAGLSARFEHGILRFPSDMFTSLAQHYRAFKFVLAFENASALGYITEKLFCALLGRAVPIYWGDPLIAEILDPRCFINAHDFASPDALIDYVLEVERDEARYRQYLAAPVFREPQGPACARPERLESNLRAFVRRLERPDYPAKAVCDAFQRECLSRLQQQTAKELAPRIRSAAFALPASWERPRALRAHKLAETVARDPAWRAEPDLL